MSLSPVAILHDAAGNALKVIQDGSDYLLGIASKLRNAAGTIVNPATEDTLSAADTKLGTIDGVLDAIKDTDGVKKIVDPLPAGTNEIGKVAQGTKAAGSGAWPQVLYDASGNAVGVVLDGTIYRIQSDSKVAKGGSALVHLDAIDTVSGQGRLKCTVYTPDGDPVAFGAASASIKNDFVKASGSSDLLVDGSSTPIVFTYEADDTYDVSLQEIKFTLSSNSITFGTGYFGAIGGGLTNGLLLEIITNSGAMTVELYNFNRNESFVNFASPGGFEWVVSSKDMMTANCLIGGGLKLYANTADKVRLTVRDNITSAGTYFKCFVKGNLLTAV